MIEQLKAESIASGIESLSVLLHACVHAGAGISFILPFSLEDVRQFWFEKVNPGVRAGSRKLLVARKDGVIVGSVQLDLATPPNQQHRAEVAKLLVHPNARRQGIARSLMLAIEDVARAEGRSLITFDTRTGDAAEPLYLSMGYTRAGVIPRYARDSHSARLDATSIFYKEL